MSAIRMLFIVVALLIGVGIWLTGVDKVHWLLYLPPALLLFAGITGICPGYIILSKLGFRRTGIGNRL